MSAGVMGYPQNPPGRYGTTSSESYGSCPHSYGADLDGSSAAGSNSSGLNGVSNEVTQLLAQIEAMIEAMVTQSPNNMGSNPDSEDSGGGGGSSSLGGMGGGNGMGGGMDLYHSMTGIQGQPFPSSGGAQSLGQGSGDSSTSDPALDQQDLPAPVSAGPVEALAQPAGSTSGTSVTPGVTPASSTTPSTTATPDSTVSPSSSSTPVTGTVDGGGPNKVTIKNTTDKPMEIAFFKNKAPGEPNFSTPEMTQEIPAGGEAEDSLPADWAGRAQKYDGSAADPASWDEMNFQSSTGQTWFDESLEQGDNASMQISSGGQTAGSSQSILGSAPSDIVAPDSSGTDVIDATQSFNGTTNQNAANFYDGAVGNTNAYVVPTDNNAVRVSTSHDLTLTLGNT